MSAFPVLLGGALLVLTHQAPQQPTFRAATELVEVDVRVFDKDARFVTSLTADDFELTEDGVARPIDVLYLVAAGQARVVSPGTPGETSGSAAASNPARQTWIFVFDVPHLSPAGLNRTREALRTFISERFSEGDIGGIVGERGMINNRLTSDRGELERAAASVSLPGNRGSVMLEMRDWPRLRDEQEVLQIAARDGETLRAAVARGCQDDPSFCQPKSDLRRQHGIDAEAQLESMLMEKARRLAVDLQTSTLQTARTLSALTRGLARVPGPKTIVLFSEGFVSERLESELQTIVAHAGVAGARIYSLDARGLARGHLAGMMDARNADNPLGAIPGGHDLLSDGINALAIDSGGLAIRNENNVRRALERIERDSGTYYVLGYRPVTAAEDGRFHRIAVRTKNRGLEVRARRGYLALPRARLLTPAPKESSEHARAKPEGAEGRASGDARLAAPPPSEIPRAPRALNVSDEVIRKIVEFAQGAASSRSAGNAATGWGAYQRGDVAAAATDLRAAVDGGDIRPWVRYALGFAHAAAGEWRLAVGAWEQVRADVPEYQETYFDLADAYLQLGDAAAALAVLRDAEKRWPSDTEVCNAVGVVQIGRGALDDAVKTFEKAVKAAPGESLGYFNLGRAYSMRYFKSQRYSGSRRAWIGNIRDRDLAAAQFEKYLALGGPYEQQAREALAALAWK